MPSRPNAGEKPAHYTQRQIANLLALETGISFAASERLLSGLSAAIRVYLKRGQIVGLPKFGRLQATHRNSHPGRNPNTGAAIFISARYNVRFRAYKALRDRL